MNEAEIPGGLQTSAWDPKAFVDHLAAGWQLSDPDAFVAHFRPVIHPDVISRQPLSKPRVGIDALEKQFRDIFRLLPGATAAIRSWGSAQPNVYVEFQISAPGGGRGFRMNTCDRFTLVNGSITERCVYFDPGALLAFALRRPGRWTALLRAR
jgi:hypothetical protein